MPFAQKHIGFEDPPKLFLKQDQENASNPLGKTAFYDPAAKSITLYVTARHPKDILRSLGHELVHHKQNCCGEFEDAGDMSAGYAQNNPFLRTKEEEANRDGSMCLRDFEDMLKKENTIYYEHLSKGDNKMSIKDWKNKEVSQLLSEAWGFKFNSLQEFDEFNGTGELQAEGEEEIEEKRDYGRNRPHDSAKYKDEKPVPEGEEDEQLEEGDDVDIEEGKVRDVANKVGAAADKVKKVAGAVKTGVDAVKKLTGEEEEIEEGFTTNMPKDIPTTGQVMQKMRDDGTAPDEPGDKKTKDKKKKDESIDHLKEAITSLLRKKLKG